MRISDWSSDVCSSDLSTVTSTPPPWRRGASRGRRSLTGTPSTRRSQFHSVELLIPSDWAAAATAAVGFIPLDLNRSTRAPIVARRSEEHTSELQSLMRISYAVFCLKKQKTKLQPEKA